MIFLMLSNRLTNQIQHFSIDRTPLKFSKTFQFSVRLRINPKTKMFIFFHMACRAAMHTLPDPAGFDPVYPFFSAVQTAIYATRLEWLFVTLISSASTQSYAYEQAANNPSTSNFIFDLVSSFVLFSEKSGICLPWQISQPRINKSICFVFSLIFP